MRNDNSAILSLGFQRSGRILRWTLAVILSLGTFVAISPDAVAARNRCKDRCADRYNYRKDLCKEIPLKYERHRCENSAKHAKDDCKHQCR